MPTADAMIGDLVAAAAAAGVVFVLRPDGTVRVRGGGRLPPALRADLVAREREVVRHVRANPAGCPGCGRPLDRGRCWGCHYRGCEGCGRPTGSAFIATCIQCGLTAGGEA